MNNKLQPCVTLWNEFHIPNFEGEKADRKTVYDYIYKKLKRLAKVKKTS